MKDITHYFADLPRKAESASVAVEEVSAERAKIDNDTAAAVASKESRAKHKRGKVKIKISIKDSSEGAVCDIVNRTDDLVDKMPSPFEKKGKKRHANSVDEPSTKNSSESITILNGQGLKSVTKKSKNSTSSHSKDQPDQPISEKFVDFFSNGDQKETKKETTDTENISSKKKDKIKQVEKLIELADKKGYTKRKVREEEEAVKIEKRLEKRKKLFTIEPNKNTETNPSDENSPKNETPSMKKSSLLNYFSKATPEQHEKERELMNTKVITKAEVHTPLNSPVHVDPISNKKTKSSQKKKAKSNLKQSPEDVNEILLIQSETVILSPKKEKINSPLGNNKQKWSMKIQLQSNNNILDDEEMYTPTAKQKENIRNNEKIPKILLPIKSKKTDLGDSPTNNNVIKNKKEKESLQINLEKEQSKTENEKIKTDTCEKISDKTSVTEIEIINVNEEKDGMDDDCQIINENLKKNKKDEKLAPLFQRKVKPSADTVAARRLFLQSDIQENSNNNEVRKPICVGPSILPFPKVSHIDQLSVDDNSLKEALKFSLKNIKKVELPHDDTLMITVIDLNNATSITENLYECVKTDEQTLLSELESVCPDTLSIWKYVSQLTKLESIKKLPRTRRKSDKKNSKQINDKQNELLNSPWTDKYRPKSSSEIVGNEEAAQKLKIWLESWKSSKNNEDYSSSEEFCNSDGSNMSNNFVNSHVAILTGPHGSGKTASVYAVAQELGYKVLEVNASSKRPGKKILKDFEEATKSHRVKKTDIKDMFTSTSKKTKETEKISQNSLILMEDVDIVFEEDEGFISATFQLASNTKRPIVMTLTDSCPHLSKIAPNQLQINFEPISGNRVSTLLQLIALAESDCKLSQSCIEALCQYRDIRKSLLQLQYLLLSGVKPISFNSLAVNKLTWKDMKNRIYKPAIKAVKSEKKTTQNDKTSNNSLNNLVDCLDNFCLISTMIDIEDPTSHLLDLKFEPNISLTENMRYYSHVDNTSSDIGNWLNDSILKLNLTETKNLDSQTGKDNCKLKTKKQIITVDSTLRQIASNTLDRRALAVDYLPNIRTICRAEEVRNQSNSKRANRFFHYLQGSKLSNGAMRSGNILSAACRMLQDKTIMTET